MIIVTSHLMAPMDGEEYNADWYGNVGALHYLRIIEASLALSSSLIIFTLHLDTTEGLFLAVLTFSTATKICPSFWPCWFCPWLGVLGCIFLCLPVFLYCSFEFGLYVRLFVGSSLSVYSGGPGLRIDFLSWLFLSSYFWISESIILTLKNKKEHNAPSRCL